MSERWQVNISSDGISLTAIITGQTSMNKYLPLWELWDPGRKLQNFAGAQDQGGLYWESRPTRAAFSPAMVPATDLEIALYSCGLSYLVADARHHSNHFVYFKSYNHYNFIKWIYLLSSFCTQEKLKHQMIKKSYLFSYTIFVGIWTLAEWFKACALTRHLLMPLVCINRIN